MVELWMATAAANVIMVVVYAMISFELVSALVKGRQWATNPLLTVTAAVFVTCTLGHGMHLEHAVLAASGFWGAGGEAVGAAARATFSDPRLLVWDAITAVVAVYFYTLRSRFAIVTRGAAFCEDMAKREAQALELHDNVVQGLVQAKLELDLGRREEGLRTIEATLGSAKQIITGLLGSERSDVALAPGELRRSEAAGGR
jgi:hypothetical protein